MKENQDNYLVIGVGKATSRLLPQIAASNYSCGISLLAISKDQQHLMMLQLPEENKLCLDKDWWGSYRSYEEARGQALHNKELFKDMFDRNYKAAIIMAGFGGYTATGVTPVIMEVLHELDIPAICIASYPFKMEGNKRSHIADEGLEILRKQASLSILFQNEAILLDSKDMSDWSIIKAFDKSDELFKSYFDSAIKNYPYHFR